MCFAFNLGFTRLNVLVFYGRLSGADVLSVQGLQITLITDTSVLLPLLEGTAWSTGLVFYFRRLILTE